MLIQPGTTLQNRYQIERALSEHDTGGVYLAHDQHTNEMVVVKAFASLDQQTFESRATELAKRIHPNLPEVLDWFSLDPDPDPDAEDETEPLRCLVMEHVAGQSLADKLAKQGALDEAETYTHMSQVLAAVDYLHGRQPPLIHGDIKPANIIINAQGDAILVDYGIAQTLNPHTPATLVAPEQVAGEAEPRSDVYAIAATLYTLLSGKVPGGHKADAPDRFDIVPIKRLASRINPAVAQVIDKALAHKPDGRHQTVRELRKAYGRAHTRAVQKEAAPPQRRPISRWLAGFILLFMLGGLYGLWRNQSNANVPVADLQTETTAPPTGDSPAITDTLAATASPAPPMPTFQPELLVTEIATQTPTITPTPTSTATSTGTVTPATPATPTPTNTATPTDSPTPVEATEVDDEVIFPGVTAIDSDDSMVLVFVPRGEFIFGSDINVDNAALSDERPQLVIDLPSFWIDQHEVTNSQYFRCIMEGQCTRPASFDSAQRTDYFTDPEYASYPVIWVTWEQANDYCTWADRKLPNELQWEKAARSIDGRIYPWGNQPPNSELANYGINIGDTTEAGAYPEGASPYGVLDMAGNVAEWVGNYYKTNYIDFVAFLVATPDPDTQADRVYAIRNGAWNHSGNSLRAATRRFPLNLGYSDSTVGFRCMSEMRPD